LSCNFEEDQCYRSTSSSEVGCCVDLTAAVVVASKWGLILLSHEGIVWSRTHNIIIIHSGALCTAASPHAPCYKSKTAEEDSTTNTTDDTSDDLLAGCAEATAAASTASTIIQLR